MSAGKFERSKYEGDDGTIHPIRIQPETATATIGGTANTAPAGAITAGALSARSTGSKRGIGLIARKISFAFNPGAEPAGYAEEATGTIVVLKKAHYDGISIGQTVSYLGGTGVVIGKSAEGKR